MKARSWGKILNHLKREHDIWATQEFKACGYADIKLAHIPVLMNIDVEGTTNNVLATRTKVTKQAMSKVIKELQEMGYIRTKVSAADKRIVTLLLTERGKRLVVDARHRSLALNEEFKKVLGEKAYDKMIDHMLMILAHMEQRSSSGQ